MVTRQRLADLLAAFAVFILLFNVLTMTYIGFHNNDNIPWQYLITGVPFLGFFVLRERVSNFNVLVAVYIFFFFLLVLVLMPLTLAFLASMTGLIIGLKLKFDDKALRLTKPIVYAMFAGFIILFVIGEAFTEVSGLGIFIAISSLLCMLVAFLQIYTTNFDLELQKANRSHIEPAPDVIMTGKVSTIGFFATFIVLGGFLIAFPIGAVLLNAIQTFMAFIRSILAGFLPYNPFRNLDIDLPHIDLHTDFDGPGVFFGDYTYYGYESNNNLLFLTIFILLMIVILPLALIIWSFITRHKDRNIKKKFRRQEGASEQTQSHKFRLSHLADLFRGNRGPKHPIRKAYIKKVQSHIKQGTIVLNTHTTDTIANNIKPKENIDGLTNSYNQARYGRD